MNKDKILLLVVGVVIVAGIIFGISYAYNAKNKKPEVNIKQCFELEIGDTGSSINLTNATATSEKLALELDPYEVTIKNICNKRISFDLKVEILENSNIGVENVKIKINNNPSDIISDLNKTKASNENSVNAYIIHTGSLDTGISVKKEIRAWIDENVISELKNNQTFESVITVATNELNPSSCDSLGITNLKECILATNELNGGVPNFDNSYEMYETGLWNYPEEEGNSYYFRGDKEKLNNNLIFAGFQWKIVRIDKDGNIKLIYNGECPNNSCTINSTGKETQIGISNFNDDKTILEYNKSNIKRELETWYTNNIISRDLNIADVIYCQDTKIYLEREKDIVFASAGRLASYTLFTEYLDETFMPDLACSQSVDRYTKSDLTGNGLLGQKVGLLTADETMLGGSTNNIELMFTNNYLNTGENYWLLSPFVRNIEDKAMYSWYMRSRGIINGSGNINEYGIRPVIALNSTTMLLSGDGSLNNPYIVE